MMFKLQFSWQFYPRSKRNVLLSLETCFTHSGLPSDEIFRNPYFYLFFSTDAHGFFFFFFFVLKMKKIHSFTEEVNFLADSIIIITYLRISSSQNFLSWLTHNGIIKICTIIKIYLIIICVLLFTHSCSYLLIQNR